MQFLSLSLFFREEYVCARTRILAKKKGEIDRRERTNKGDFGAEGSADDSSDEQTGLHPSLPPH